MSQLVKQSKPGLHVRGHAGYLTFLPVSRVSCTLQRHLSLTRNAPCLLSAVVFFPQRSHTVDSRATGNVVSDV